MDLYIKVNLLMEKKLELELIYGVMELNIMVNGKIMILMVGVFISLKMVKITLENGLIML